MGATLAHRFHMDIDPYCFCATNNETLEHLFFECELPRILVAWVYFNLRQINPTAGRFTVEELLFGFCEDRQWDIPSIFIFILQVMKHTIWVARCNFRFRDQQPVAHECLSKAIAKLKFILYLLGRRCRSPLKFACLSESSLPTVFLGTLRGRSWSSEASFLFLLF